MAVITLSIDLTSGRLTVPSEPLVDSHHRHHSHHRPRCILRAPHPSETHACRSSTTPSRSLPPSALQPRLHGASHLKSPSIITASSAISRRPRVYPAPHHRLLVSSLYPHIVHSTSNASLLPQRQPDFLRARYSPTISRLTDTLDTSFTFHLCFIHFCIFQVSIICVFLSNCNVATCRMIQCI